MPLFRSTASAPNGDAQKATTTPLRGAGNVNALGQAKGGTEGNTTRGKNFANNTTSAQSPHQHGLVSPQSSSFKAPKSSLAENGGTTKILHQKEGGGDGVIDVDASDDNDEDDPNKKKGEKTPAAVMPLSRKVWYPDNKGLSSDGASNKCLQERLAKRVNIDYHQPEPKKVKKSEGEKNVVMGSGLESGGTKVEAKENQNNGEVGKNKEEGKPEEEEEEEEKSEVISRLPPSNLGMMYFQVDSGGAEATLTVGVNFDKVGILVVDLESCAGQLFDRCGRQYGNRPTPGYPLKESDIHNMQAGTTLKIGTKNLRLTTALYEETFRQGEFFLRQEHDLRKKEEKKRAQMEAVVHPPKIKFGGPLFAAMQFRKRPRSGSTGFVVPVQGRVKTNGGRIDKIESLFDPEKLKDPVVLFRADYKRDSLNRLIASVVVDPIIGDKLRPHQRVGVKFLYDCLTGERMPGYYGAILADEMGLGKTIQTIATIWTCLKQGKFGKPIAKKCLVVAPSSLVKNWCNEFDKWLGVGALKAFAISESTPKGDRILSRFDGEGDVLVISYDQLRKYISRISTMNGVDLCVCDEGHRLKNAEIKTTKAVDLVPTKRRIILSGTPIQNDLTEFHAMVGFVNPGILGAMDLFKRVFEEPIMRGRDPECIDQEKELGADRAHYLANLTSKFILRRTQTINEKYLPAKVDVTVFVKLGEKQAYVYNAISKVVNQFASTPLVLITALKKLCNHVDLVYDAVVAENTHIALPKSIFPKGYTPGKLDFDYGSKLQFVSTMLDEITSNGERDKLVIVSNYTQTLDIIAKLCVNKKILFFQLDGKTPIKKRQELVDRFNIPMAQEVVFLLSSKAGGVGLNLIGANRLILFDPDWNPANDAQAMGRVWRDGQKKRVAIYRLLCTGTIEEKIYQRQVSKQGLSANVVDMQEDSKQHFTLEELKALFSYRPETLCDTHDLLGCKCFDTSGGAKKFNESGSKQDGHHPKMSFKKVEAKTGPRMDELKGWMHSGTPSQFALDKVLAKMSKLLPELVTFLFANERDAQKLSTHQVERAFVSDEAGIICASQTEQKEQREEDDVEIDLVQEDADDSSDDDEVSNHDESDESSAPSSSSSSKHAYIKKKTAYIHF